MLEGHVVVHSPLFKYLPFGQLSHVDPVLHVSHYTIQVSHFPEELKYLAGQLLWHALL